MTSHLAKFPFMPPSASEAATPIDMLMFAINAIAIVFSLLIFLLVIFLTIRYRQGSRVDRSNPPVHSTVLELVWTTIPSILVLGIFVWSAYLFLQKSKVPANSTEIHVIGKQWMWKIQHPNGRWENNELHVPRGQAIRLVMTSEDVIHSFFIPAFRMKQDVVPGTFTNMWFKPTEVGEYHLFCAEYCGMKHSTMAGTVYVMEPGDYQRWLNEGNPAQSVAAVGAQLFRENGCSGCHNPGSSVRAPVLEGIYGRSVPVQIPEAGKPLEQTAAKAIIADDRYLHDAIVLPEKEVAAGFRPIMPTFKNRLTEEQIFQLIAYIRQMKIGSASGGNKRSDNTNTLGEEDYRARTGFKPENLKAMEAAESGALPGRTPQAGQTPGQTR